MHTADKQFAEVYLQMT